MISHFYYRNHKKPLKLEFDVLAGTETAVCGVYQVCTSEACKHSYTRGDFKTRTPSSIPKVSLVFADGTRVEVKNNNNLWNFSFCIPRGPDVVGTLKCDLSECSSYRHKCVHCKSKLHCVVRLDFPNTNQLPILSPVYLVQRQETQKKKRKLKECQETRSFKNVKINTNANLDTMAHVLELKNMVIHAFNIICPVITQNRIDTNKLELQMDTMQRFNGHWPSQDFSPLPIEDFSDPFFPAPAPGGYAADDDWMSNIEELGGSVP